MKLGFANTIDDVNEDGSAKIWWWRAGSALNEELTCRSIPEMFTSHELFELLVLDGCVEIEEKRVWEFCCPNAPNETRGA